MFIHDFSKRIRYGETDKMGYLYYGNYPLLYEIGRSEAIRSVGISYKLLEDDYKVMMPVIHMEARYKKPIYYDENITIRTILKELPSKMIHFHHEIFNDKMELVHGAQVKLFFVDMHSGTRTSAPKPLINELKPYFEK
jgi:acyl-CoA thioester hydrolase